MHHPILAAVDGGVPNSIQSFSATIPIKKFSIEISNMSDREIFVKLLVSALFQKRFLDILRSILHLSNAIFNCIKPHE